MDRPPNGSGAATGERLESWKEVAAHFRRSTTTVQRWEREEGLPVRRHEHPKKGSVFAFTRELDDWHRARTQPAAPLVPAVVPGASDATSLGAERQEPERRSPPPASRGTPFGTFAFVSLGVVTLMGIGLAWLTAASRGPSPDAPVRLVAESSRPGTVMLAWTARSSSRAGRFDIAQTDYGVVVRRVAGAVTTTSFTDLDPGTSYHWYVRACNGGGCGDWLGPVGKTPDGSDALPAPPMTLAVRSREPGRMDMSWKDASTNETRFEIGQVGAREEAGQVGVSGLSLATGVNPRGMAFDGSDVWVINESSHTVSKIQASNGRILGTYPTGGAMPMFAAFDGANIWITHADGAIVSELRASDGAVLRRIPLGGHSSGVLFDGVSIWIANTQHDHVVKVRPSDGAVLGRFPTGTAPVQLASDGENIWVTNKASETVSKIRAADGENLGMFPTQANPFGIVFDGTSIWVANSGANTVSKLRPADGALLGVFAAGAGPATLVSDGGRVWISDETSDSISRIRASDGAMLGSVAAGNQPRNLLFDGTNIWVSNYAAGTVSKYADAALVVVRTVGPNRTAVSLDGLDPRRTYRWGVRACNVAGCSPWHGVVAGTPDGSDRSRSR